MQNKLSLLLLVLAGAALASPSWYRDGPLKDDEVPKVKAWVLGVAFEGADNGAQQATDKEQDSDLQGLKSLVDKVQGHLSEHARVLQDLQSPTEEKEQEKYAQLLKSLLDDDNYSDDDNSDVLQSLAESEQKDAQPLVSAPARVLDDVKDSPNEQGNGLASLQDLSSRDRLIRLAQRDNGATPRDHWWNCKVDNCRRNCNNQGKNGICIGPVCICWS